MLSTRLLDNERVEKRQPKTSTSIPDLICLSHLRWDLLYQRPHRVMRRFSAERRVFYIEEPGPHEDAGQLIVKAPEKNLWVVTPHLPHGLNLQETHKAQRRMIDDLLQRYHIGPYVLWYYTPLALAFTRHLEPLATVYDCSDELSLFKGETADIHQYEAQLFGRADLIFTGRSNRYEAQQIYYPHFHLFPGSVETASAGEARFADKRRVLTWR